MRQGHFWDLQMSSLKRFGMLEPGGFKWLIWSQRGEEQARIGIHARTDHLILDYKSRARGGEWQNIRDRIPLAFCGVTPFASRPAHQGEAGR